MSMRSLLLIGAAAITVGVSIGLVGKALDFGSAAYLAALVVGVLVVSLVDRDRFWAADIRRQRRERQHGAR
jgi:hypothetical protein